MSNHLSLVFTFASAIAVSSLGAHSAKAGPHMETVSIRVSSEGLDLTSPSGADEFLKRLSRAAHKACGAPDFSPLMTGADRDLRDCRAHALADAVAQSHWPLVHRQFAARPEARIVRLATR
jgi:UrcA family protein